MLAFSGASTAWAGLAAVVTDPEGRVVRTFPPSQRGVEAVCNEVEDLVGPACSAAPSTCLDADPIGICSREGFLFRLTMCSRANENDHEGHRFAWNALTPLPPALTLKAPPSTNTNPDSTSTAYLGGNLMVPPAPPAHNGEFFGLLTEPFCGEVKIHAADLCPNGVDHGACAAEFPAVIRTMEMADARMPVPSFVTTSLPDAALGLFYDRTFEGMGGTENFLFSITEGEFPMGLELGEDGSLKGIPTETGKFVFKVQLEEDPDDPVFLNPEGCEDAPPCFAFVVEREFMLTVNDAVSTTSTMTTTTSTMGPACPFPTEKCSRPVNPADDKPKAGDCLYILRAAVGIQPCCLCPCDADGNGSTTAADALRCLRVAVGAPAELECLTCPED